MRLIRFCVYCGHQVLYYTICLCIKHTDKNFKILTFIVLLKTLKDYQILLRDARRSS